MPFPPLPESPPAEAAGGEGEREQKVAVEDVEEEEAYGPNESALALMYEDAEPDVYVGTDVDPANAPLCPPRCRPLPWGAASSGTAGSTRPKVSTSTYGRVQL